MVDKKAIAIAREYDDSIPWQYIINEKDSVLVVSDMMAMKSAASYYMGRTCLTIEYDQPLYTEQFSRESEYYLDKEIMLLEYNKKIMSIRNCIENNTAYANGILPDLNE